MNREQRIRAEEAPEEQSDLAEAVAFIQGPDAIQPGDHVATLCRVTTEGQDVESQKETIRETATEKRAKKILWFCKVGLEGYSEEWFRFMETAFAQAARRNIFKFIITELSRLVRHPDYRNENVHAKPSKEQLDRIRRLAEEYGITIISIHPADSPFSKERSFQTKRGECGRPLGKLNKKPSWCKKRNEAFKQIALDAYDAVKSYRKAAEMANQAMKDDGTFVKPISYETIRKWNLKRQAGVG